jgi:hypothetical protein
MGWRATTVSLIILLASGCAGSVVDLRNTLDLNKATFHDKLAASQGLADEFLTCTARAYDERGAPGTERSQAEPDARGDGPMRAIHALITRVKEGRPAHAASLQVLEETLADLTASGYGRLDLRKLRTVVDVIRQWHVHFDFDEDALAEDGSRFAQLLLAYNKAYFGNVAYTVGSGPGIHAAVKVTSNGFIDRNGNVWRFPGLSLEATNEPGRALAVEAGQVDSQRITADLSRVFLEAFFDAAFREPAVQEATALQVRGSAPVHPYPAFDADHPPIPLEAFARVTRDALRAEAAVTSEVGKAVRGGSLFSTQNETFAAGMETAAGVIAKKLVEHGGFCYFQTIARSERKEGHPR